MNTKTISKSIFALALIGSFFFSSCSNDSDPIDPIATCTDGIKNGDETGIDCGGSCEPCKIEIQNPENYTFERNGASTVNFNGQATRLTMGGQFKGALGDNSKTQAELSAMFAHEDGNSDFDGDDLNASDKNIKSKTAASMDLFSDNSTGQAAIRADFEDWIQAQVDEVFPNWEVAASPGIAGQLPQGDKVRYVSATGLDYVQSVNKGLIGAMVLDQIVNNYLSPKVLDEGSNKADNDNDVLEQGKQYTTMEHKWDEAYGYVFALNTNTENPVEGEKGKDSFLGDYLKAVSKLPAFSSLEKDAFEAFKLGRAAIVAKDYKVRDEQAVIVKNKLNLVPAVRGVFYLQAGKNDLAEEVPKYGSGFHALAEAYGFIYSLQFAQNPATGEVYFTNTEVQDLLSQLLPLDGGENGLWDVSPQTLDTISGTIATKFGFTVEQASPQSN